MATNADTPGNSGIRDAIALAGVTIVSIVIVLATAQFTSSPIQHNQQSGLLRRLESLVPADQYDNDVLLDRIRMTAPDLLGSNQPVTILRARRSGSPVAAVLLPPGVQGYGGPIHLMIAVSHEGTVLGVQVLEHNETPGIGDSFERNDWLERFVGRSLRNPPQVEWDVERDGGYFDQMTGATVTSRAIVSMVRRTLEFYRSRRERLFSEPSEE